MRTRVPVLAVLSLVACNSNPPLPSNFGVESQPRARGSSPASATAAPIDPAVAAARAEAVEIFRTRCFVCHGARGVGDGPAAAGLTPRPRDLTQKDWQSQVTDDQIEKIIQLGGAAVGKSVAMPPNPDLTRRPAVIAALRQHIRALGN